MLKNYILIALRNIYRHKIFSLINIGGLAIGIACCSIIWLYVQDELNFDAFHEKSERIYRVVEIRQSPDKGERHIAMTAGPVGGQLVEDFPEVQEAVRFTYIGRFTVQHQERTRFYEGDYLFADAQVFDLFDFGLLKGDPNTALSDPKTVVITQKAAQKYFGEVDPWGKYLTFEGWGDMKITGVLRNPPPNSHLDFSMLISMATLTATERGRAYLSDWQSDYQYTYVLLNSAAAASSLNQKISGFLKRYQGDAGEEREIYLQPLRDVHFRSGHIEFGRNRAKGDIDYLYIFSAIALFVALIACINYMNLATARSLRRAKEVGVRKVIGAQRGQLIRQFFVEALTVTVLALLMATALVSVLLPYFNELAGKQLSIDPVRHLSAIAALAGIGLLAGLISGSYPALFLSSLRPMLILKGRSTPRAWPVRLREGLVIIQFVLSIALMIATLVVYQQLSYLQEKRLGFDQEHLVIVDINSGNARRDFATMKTEFAKSPQVRRVAVSSRIPGDWKDITEIEMARQTAPQDLYTAHFLGIDEDFLATYDMELLEGRNFTGNLKGDSASVLLNETAVKLLGLDAPLGKRLVVPESDFEAEIIGVVKDFHFRSLHEKIGPMVLGYWNNPIRVIDYFSVRVEGGNLTETLAYLESVHNQVDKVTPFEYNFLDDRLKDRYEAEMRTATLVGIAAVLAILVASMGLFGLAAFIAEQRTKEIGIRKVLGATVPGIVLMLSKEFTRLVLIAIAIAVPLAYFFLQSWLENYAYRVTPGAEVFLLAALLALGIAWVTVGYQAIKTALVDPARSLRYE